MHVIRNELKCKIIIVTLIQLSVLQLTTHDQFHYKQRLDEAIPYQSRIAYDFI